jgi:P pilus assembly chaperone PapD
MQGSNTMKRIAALAVALVLGMLLAAAAHAADVVQGKCLSYDQTAKTIVVEEYDINFSSDFKYGHPTGIQSTFNVRDAKIGITPEKDDILRIAYTLKGTDKEALKVMNVSKQDLRKK